MKSEDKRILEMIKKADFERCKMDKISETKEKAKQAFYVAESEEQISFAEFLMQQGKYIQKKWWICQFAVLLVMWMVVSKFGQTFYVKRMVGVGASMFAMFVIPELWKNRESGSIEIEGTCVYNMRQIVGARLLIFAFIDLILVSIFGCGCVASGQIMVREIVVQFLIPYLVTCCICFTCFYGRVRTMISTVISSVIWCAIWSQIILYDRVYEMISLPVWYGLLVASIAYLAMCVCRGQQRLGEIGEVRMKWN